MRTRWLRRLGVASLFLALVVSACTKEEQAPTTTSTTKTSGPTTTTTTVPVPPGDREDSGPVEVEGEAGLVLRGLRISNPDGPCVVVSDSRDVIVTDSEIGPCGGRAIEVESSVGVTMERLTIRDAASGIYVLDSEQVVVEESTFRDAGRNFVQFDKVTGPGNAISGNVGANRLGDSEAEDFVNLFQSGGTPDSPLLVEGNRFSNGGPSSSGSGIMVGDAGGSHIVVAGNVLIDPGQVGIGVPGGSHISVVGNVVYSDDHPWSNVGIYVWGQSGEGCGPIVVRDNLVEWLNSEGEENPGWDGGNCGTIEGWDDNEWSADTTEHRRTQMSWGP